MIIQKKSTDYIKRHKKYIDNRIEILSDYVSSHKEEKKTISEIIFQLIELSHNTCLLNSCNKIVIDSILEIKNLIKSWDFFEDGDIVGYIYQSIQNRSTRKQKGQFFTPDDIVTYLTYTSSNQLNNETPTILDPACGSGQFLMAIFKLLFRQQTEKGANPQLAAKRIIKDQIFGFDTDPIAIEIAKFNLMKLSKCSRKEINIIHKNFLYRDELNYRGDELEKKSFDLIIGNPPWCSKFSAEEKKYYRKQYYSIKSGLNTFTLFIERSFDFVSENGHISYLIPQAYLNIKAHQSSRQFVLESSRITNLDIWGERFKGVFAPAISIILQKDSSTLGRTKNIIEIRKNSNHKDNTSLLIPQGSYSKTHENIFNINHSKKAVNILTTIQDQDCFFLKNKAKFFLGIVTGNNEKYISDSQNEEHSDPIIIGKDLKQYNYTFSNHYFKYNPEKLQQVAPKNLYLKKEKILYKFIGKRLTFAIDRNGYYSLNNVNGIIPGFDNLNIESIISLLNSKVMQYYYENNFFTVKVLRGNLERLPIKQISRSTQKKLKKYTESITSMEGETYSDIRENIEDIVFHEYGINDKEAYMISDLIN